MSVNFSVMLSKFEIIQSCKLTNNFLFGFYLKKYIVVYCYNFYYITKTKIVKILFTEETDVNLVSFSESRTRHSYKDKILSSL